MSRKTDIDGVAARALLHRIFGSSMPVTYRRTPEGVSTQVYRIQRGSEVFYLRIAEEADENLEAEAGLHRRLRALGVKVADVIHVDPFNSDIGRSAMVTTEIRGAPVTQLSDQALAASVVEQAGADLAVINQIPVDGFGFIRRQNPRWPLPAEYPCYEDFLTAYFPQPWPGPLASLFDRTAIRTVEDLVEHERSSPPTAAKLSHGDFDLTQIFCADGHYTGLIDFGEIRGADPWFDLSHFLLCDQDAGPAALLPALLNGYQSIRPLPPGYESAIHDGAILLGLRQLCRWLGPPLRRPLEHPAVEHRKRRLHQLISLR
ncbi:aminoglycoside phosphotransferase family protein [Actinoplanes sp. NPDC051851]|uniref:phosphotransferase family protein n=1 Tax=Actinoplanes sp. NPDC051851 TaxID=3154753 RepID=UPI00343F1B0B